MSRFFVRLAISIAALIVMLIAASFATGYFAFALFLYLEEHMLPAWAALLTGLILLLLAAILAAATQMTGRRSRIPPEGLGPRDTRENAAEMGGEIGRRLAGFASTHKKGSMLAALIAGFAVGVSPRLREFLLDILKK